METKGILKGIQIVMSEIGAIGKDKRNDTQKFNYRGIDDVMNKLHPLMAKAHIVICPDVEEVNREERVNSNGKALIYTLVRVAYNFICTDDGSSVTVRVYGEGMDSGDKSLNKAMSIAMKYACFQLFCIPTEEMVDPDKDSYEVKPVKKKETYPKEFLDACKLQTHGSTMGKLYKDNRDLFEHIKLNGTEDEVSAAFEIEKYMQTRK